jgi:glycosyltransferase involved in cell wall biosynthesis
VTKPKLLVLSHVLPFPRSAGQQQRVFYTLQAARETFHVTFATSARTEAEPRIRAELAGLCDEVLVLPALHQSNKAAQWRHRMAATLYTLKTGLKRSNYFIGEVAFHPDQIAPLLDAHRFDCVLFEYWHAAGSVVVFRRKQIPCVLDMHDILWQAYSKQLDARTMPAVLKRWALGRYRRQEETAWLEFDGLIAINREEEKYVAGRLPIGVRVFHAPMGTDLRLWPYCWQPAKPPRVAYYGSLSSPHNQKDALACIREIMPRVWLQRPETELWIVGSNPPAAIKRLAHTDTRIHVTGYIADVQSILKTMTAVVCPWSGTYGFRSRLVEVMALGVPTVASPDAVSGMELEEGKGLLFGCTNAALAAETARLLVDPAFAAQQSLMARGQVEELFSLEKTYKPLVRDIDAWLHTRSGPLAPLSLTA